MLLSAVCIFLLQDIFLLVLIAGDELKPGTNVTTTCPKLCVQCSLDDIMGFKRTSASVDLIQGCTVFGGYVDGNHYFENHMIRIKNDNLQSIYLKLYEHTSLPQTFAGVTYKFVLASQKATRWLVSRDTFQSKNVTFHFTLVPPSSTIENQLTDEEFPSSQIKSQVLKYPDVQFRVVVSRLAFETTQLASYVALHNADEIELLIGRTNQTEERCAIKTTSGHKALPSPDMFQANTLSQAIASQSCSFSGVESPQVYIVNVASHTREMSVQVELNRAYNLKSNSDVIIILTSSYPVHWTVTSDVKRTIPVRLKFQVSKSSTVDTGQLLFNEASGGVEVERVLIEGNLFNPANFQFANNVRAYAKFTGSIDLIRIEFSQQDDDVALHEEESLLFDWFWNKLTVTCTSSDIIILVDTQYLKPAGLEESDLIFGDGSCHVTRKRHGQREDIRVTTAVPSGCGLQRISSSYLRLWVGTTSKGNKIGFPVICKMPLSNLKIGIYDYDDDDDLSLSKPLITAPAIISTNISNLVVVVNMLRNVREIPHMSFHLNKCFLRSDKATFPLIINNCPAANQSVSFVAPYRGDDVTRQAFSFSIDRLPRNSGPFSLICVWSKCITMQSLEEYTLPKCQHEYGLGCNSEFMMEETSNFTARVEIGPFLFDSLAKGTQVYPGERDAHGISKNVVILIAISSFIFIIILMLITFLIFLRCCAQRGGVDKKIHTWHGDYTQSSVFCKKVKKKNDVSKKTSGCKEKLDENTIFSPFIASHNGRHVFTKDLAHIPHPSRFSSHSRIDSDVQSSSEVHDKEDSTSSDHCLSSLVSKDPAYLDIASCSNEIIPMKENVV